MVSSSSCKSVEWKKKWWCTCQTSNFLPTKKNLNFWDIFIDGVLNLLTYTIPKIIYYESLQKGFKSGLLLLIKTKKQFKTFQRVRLHDQEELHGPLRPVHGEHRDLGHQARNLEEPEGGLQGNQEPDRCSRYPINVVGDQ